MDHHIGRGPADRPLARHGRREAALVAGVVALLALARGRAIPGVGALLIVGAPLLAGGQVWVIGLLAVRVPRTSGRRWAMTVADWRTRQNPRTVLFAGLPAPAAYGIIAVLFLAWLAAMTAFPALSQGGPTHGTPGCSWVLESHGAITCVSHTSYLRAGAAVQRFAAGVLACFYVMHFGVLTSELVRRRLGGDAAPATGTQEARPDV
jgi:hypothetical protein